MYSITIFNAWYCDVWYYDVLIHLSKVLCRLCVLVDHLAAVLLQLHESILMGLNQINTQLRMSLEHTHTILTQHLHNIYTCTLCAVHPKSHLLFEKKREKL